MTRDEDNREPTIDGEVVVEAVEPATDEAPWDITPLKQALNTAVRMARFVDRVEGIDGEFPRLLQSCLSKIHKILADVVSDPHSRENPELWRTKSKALYQSITVWLEHSAEADHLMGFAADVAQWEQDLHISRNSDPIARAMEGVRSASSNLRALLDMERAKRDSIQASEAAQRSIDASQAAQRSAELAREAAGEAGNAAVSEHFDKLSATEGRMYWVWVVLLFAALVASLIVGLRWLSIAETLTLSQQLGHVLITLPILAFAAFAGREAGHHRLARRWAANRAVQLKSVGAFIDPLPEEMSDKVRYELSLTLFRDDNVKFKLETGEAKEGLPQTSFTLSDLAGLQDLIETLIKVRSKEEPKE